MQIVAKLDADSLSVSFLAALPPAPRTVSRADNFYQPMAVLNVAASCDDCGRHECFRHTTANRVVKIRKRSAFLLDTAWPEYVRFVAENHEINDVMAIPIRGDRWKKANYAWQTAGFSSIHTTPLTTLIAAYRIRALAEQGAARQQALLKRSSELAGQLAKALLPEVDEVVVSQALLPFLWRSGDLGGRRVRVLMTQMPIREMESLLDDAALVHPESSTLKDFRAPEWLKESEAEALAEAAEIVTPHHAVAALFAKKTTLLDWEMPDAEQRDRDGDARQDFVVFFAGSTVGRKGAYEMRAAAMEDGLTVMLGGPVIECADFWSGVQTVPMDSDWLRKVSVVVAPSVVEAQPRRLLRAIANGLPVVATAATGLHPNSRGLSLVEPLVRAGLSAVLQKERRIFSLRSE